MNRKTKCLVWGITGVVVGFTAFWLGAYFLSQIPLTDWRSFPAFVTTGVVVWVSVIGGFLGIGKYFDP